MQHQWVVSAAMSVLPFSLPSRQVADFGLSKLMGFHTSSMMSTSLAENNPKWLVGPVWERLQRRAGVRVLPLPENKWQLGM